MFILKVCAALEKAGVIYGIVGGYAVALHGVVRGTVDVDIAIQWNFKNLKKAEETLKSLGLVSLLPLDAHMIFQFREEYIKKRNLIAWNFYNPLNPTQQVDLLITYHLKSAKNTKQIKIGTDTLRILNLKDLVQMKLESGRPQDLEDAKALKIILQQSDKSKER